MKKWILIGVGLLVIGGGAFAYLKMSSSNGNTGPETVEITRGTLVEKALATGEIVPRHEIAVKSKISGTVARIFREEGDRVEAGDRLIEIKPSPTPLEYARAKRALEMRSLAEKERAAELTRVKGLLDRGMKSQADYDNARESFEQAALACRLAEEELAILDKGKAVVAGRSVESIIVSPVAGHVLKRHVDVGDPVVPLTSYQPGTELMVLANMDELLFRGTADEIDVGKIREGMPVEIRVGAFPDSTVTGRLSKISLKSHKRDNATVFDVEISDLAAPSDIQLRAGYSANADIIIKRAADVLMIPERVIEFRDDSTFVRLPKGEGKEFEERLIEIGMSDGIHCEVVSGLEEGDKVLEKETREIE